MSEGASKGTDFWSRRKAAVREAEVAEQERIADAEIAEERAALEKMDDEDILEELGLPEPESLTVDDDFKPFLQKTVPEHLKRRALRRLWTLNPVLANVDGLVDYGGDFTDAATVIPDLKTVYQVGKGMIDRFAELIDESEDNGDNPISEESGSENSSINTVEITNSAAVREDFIQNGNAFIHLTQGDTLMQDELAQRELSLAEDVDSVEENTPARTKRRIRFDYSG